MNNIGDLQKLAHKLVTEKINSGEIVQMEWAVQEIVKAQGKITGRGVPFYTICARDTTYRAVKKAIDIYEGKSENEEDRKQLLLEGFDHLQAAYTVERDGERVLVPTSLMTDKELLARADEYEKQAKSLREHAKEIRQYVSSKEKRKAG